MGKARYDANDAKGAREAAEKVLALDANNAPVQMLLATLSLSAGDKVAEKEALQRYLTLEPNGASAEEAKALLAR
jgi:predicted Zn-dependent protease